MRSSKPKTSSARKSGRTFVIIVSCLVVLSLILATMLTVGFDAKDGAEKYTGVEYTVAQKALAFSRSNNGPTLTTQKFKVASVERVSLDGICNDTIGESITNPGTKLKVRYAVSVGSVGLLGVVGTSYKIHVCEY